MLSMLKTLLKKEPDLIPHQGLFEVPPSPATEKMTEGLNRLLALALPAINAGQELDVNALAKEAGVNAEAARTLLELTLGRMEVLKKKADGRKK